MAARSRRVLAARLSEDPGRRVVMIEAGPDFLDPATTPAMVRYGWGGTSIIDEPLDLDWGYCATATPTSGEIAVPRGRLIGGSGSINGTIFLRALPEDIDGWRAVAGPVVDWPTMDARLPDAGGGRAVPHPDGGRRPIGWRPRRRSSRRASPPATARSATRTRRTRWAPEPCPSTRTTGFAGARRWPT